MNYHDTIADKNAEIERLRTALTAAESRVKERDWEITQLLLTTADKGPPVEVLPDGSCRPILQRWDIGSACQLECRSDDIGKWVKHEDAQAALEAERKDGERYRWLRSQHWNDSAICCVANPKDSVKLGAYCPSEELLDEAIDAAIAASSAKEN